MNTDMIDQPLPPQPSPECVEPPPRRSHPRMTLPASKSLLLRALLMMVFLGLVPAWAHENPIGCTGSGLGISLFADRLDAHVGERVCYSALVFNTAFPACLAENVIAAIVTPDGITNRFTLRRTTLNPGDSDFYTNVVCYTIRAQDVLADGTVRATAFDNGLIHQNDTDSLGGGFQGVNTEVVFPCILVTKQCVGGVGENGAITFTGTVRNCGNVQLNNVTVTNFVNGGAFQILGPVTLNTNQTLTFQGSYIPLNPCVPTTDTLIARGTDTLTFPSNVVSSVSATCVNTLTAGIRVGKVCPPVAAAPGQLVNYSGSVTNTGNVTLTNITVVSDLPAPNTTVFTLATLAPGAVANFTASYAAPTNCSVASGLTARGTSICGVSATDSVSSTCPIVTAPQISVTAICPATPPGPGGVLTYSGTVRNTGNISLNNVVVTADRPGANSIVISAGTLAPGASANFTGSFTVPAGACSTTVNLAATGSDVCTSRSVTNTTVLTCPITTAPRVVVTLACPPNAVAPGALISFSGTVSNPGNIMLNNVTVVNNQPGLNTVILSGLSLAPGASTNFTATFAAPADACSVSSTVVASGTDACGGTVTTNAASATCPLLTTPRIVVTQICPGLPVSLGGLLTYSGSVSNAGNITLTNVVVVNDRTGNTPVFTAATLAPGAVVGFTGSFTVPVNNTCSIASTLTARANDKCTGTQVTANALSTCPLLGAPTIGVGLICPVGTVPLGGTLAYTGIITNTGNITVTNIVIVSDRPAAGTVIFTTASLAPGAVAGFSGSFTVPQTDACSISTTVSATARDVCAATLVTAGNSITCPLAAAPRIVVTRFCPPVPGAPGTPVFFSGNVTNAGNVTLTNIIVTQGAPASTVFTVASLAPGASANFTGSFIAPLDACTASSTLAASGQALCTGVTVSNSVTTTCPLATAPQIRVTKACPPLPVPEGGTLVFTGTVTNTGNITLNNVFVFNDRPTANTQVIGPLTLAPGAGTNFSGSYVVPFNTCSITDTLTAIGRDNCTGLSVTNAATSTCPIGTSPRIDVTVTCPVLPTAPGAQFTYTGTVRNPGNVALNNVVILSDQPAPNTTVLTIPTLAPGGSSNFSAMFISPADFCSVTTTVIARGTDACSGVTASTNASAACTLTTTPRITVTQECPPVPASIGGLLTFSGVVSNPGNVTLNNVVVSNNRNGAPTVGLVGYWDLNETSGSAANDLSGTGHHGTVINATHVAGDLGGALRFNGTNSLVDIPNGTRSLNFNGPVTMAARVRAQSTSGLRNIIAHGFTASPQLEVFLRIRDGAYEAGSVTNGVAYVVRASIPPEDAGRYVRLAAVYDGVSWSIYRNGALIATTPSPVGAVLMNAPWAIGSRSGVAQRVFEGDIDEVRIYRRALSGAEIIGLENPAGSPAFTIASLAPGASAAFTSTFAVPTGTECSISSIVTAQGTDKCSGQTVSATAASTCPVLTSPDIEVRQVCPTTPVGQGTILTYTGFVRNTGNSTLTNVVVTSDRPGSNSVVFTTAMLLPGAEASFTGSYQVPTNCCVIANTLRGRGTDCNAITVTDTATATCVVITNPRIAVTKVCPTEVVAVGETLTYRGTVSNVGDIVLIEVTVSINQPGGGSVALGPITLAPGETVPYTASYIVPPDFCGTDTVTARGLDVCTFAPVVNSVTNTCPVVTNPRIAVTKTCPATPTPRNGIFTYTGFVSNPGDVTLINVLVFDNRPTNNTPVIGPITLAPGQSVPFTRSYPVPECVCCSILDTLTATGQDRCSGTNVRATASAVCPLLSAPQITVSEVCPTAVVGVGGLYVFSGTVRNSGDIVLTNVMVFASQAGAASIFGPVDLGPGEAKTFTGSFVVGPTANPAANIVTAIGWSTCQTLRVVARANCFGPVLSIPTIGPVTALNGVVTVTWTSEPGVTYFLQRKDSLSDPVWIDIPGSVTASAFTASKVDLVAPARQRYYRVRIVE